jgi:cytochrome c2
MLLLIEYYFMKQMMSLLLLVLLFTACGVPDVKPAEKQAALSEAALKGKTLFIGCAACHAVNKELTGPALAGVEGRWPDRKLLFEYIRNNDKVRASGDPYAVKLYEQYNRTMMNAFPNLTDENIESLLAYIKETTGRTE